MEDEIREVEVIVVARHKAVLDYLIDKKRVPPGTQLFNGVNESKVRGKHVFGILPIWLAAYAERVTWVLVDLPRTILSSPSLQYEEVYNRVQIGRTYRTEELGTNS